MSAFLLLGACGSSTELRDDATRRLLDAAEVIRDSMASGDMAAVVNQIPDDLFPGGAPAKRAALVTAEASRDGVAEIAMNMKWDLPGTIHRVGDQHVCVLRYESSMNGLPMKACQIAVSRDGGGTWSFISGSSAGISGLRITAPELLDAIMPEIQAVKVGGSSDNAGNRATAAEWERDFGSPELPAGEGSEALSFAWPDGIRLHVIRTATRVVDGPGRTNRYQSVLEYDLFGKQTDDGYSVHFENIKETSPGQSPTGDALVLLDHWSEMLRDWPVDFLVRDAEVPPRLEDADRVREELRARFRKIPGVVSEPAAEAMIATMFSDSAFTDRSLEVWNRMVGIWHGNTIDFNHPFSFEYTTGTGEATVENVITYSAHPSPLRGKDPGRSRLVRLFTRQIPNDLSSALRRSGTQLPVSAVSSPESEIRTWVDASPELIPERFVRVRTLTMSVAGAGRVRTGTRWEYVFRRGSQ